MKENQHSHVHQPFAILTNVLLPFSPQTQTVNVFGLSPDTPGDHPGFRVATTSAYLPSATLRRYRHYSSTVLACALKARDPTLPEHNQLAADISRLNRYIVIPLKQSADRLLKEKVGCPRVEEGDFLDSVDEVEIEEVTARQCWSLKSQR